MTFLSVVFRAAVMKNGTNTYRFFWRTSSMKGKSYTQIGSGGQPLECGLEEKTCIGEVSFKGLTTKTNVHQS